MTSCAAGCRHPLSRLAGRHRKGASTSTPPIISPGNLCQGIRAQRNTKRIIWTPTDNDKIRGAVVLCSVLLERKEEV